MELRRLREGVKGLHRKDKDGLLSVCGEPQKLWHEFCGRSAGGSILVCAPSPPPPCIVHSQPLLLL